MRGEARRGEFPAQGDLGLVDIQADHLGKSGAAEHGPGRPQWDGRAIGRAIGSLGRLLLEIGCVSQGAGDGSRPWPARCPINDVPLFRLQLWPRGRFGRYRAGPPASRPKPEPDKGNNRGRLSAEEALYLSRNTHTQLMSGMEETCTDGKSGTTTSSNDRPVGHDIGDGPRGWTSVSPIRPPCVEEGVFPQAKVAPDASSLHLMGKGYAAVKLTCLLLVPLRVEMDGPGECTTSVELGSRGSPFR